MDYFYDRNALNICVRIDSNIYSEKARLNEILMPETFDLEGVKFSCSGLISLSEFISYTTEKDMLYFVYYFLKALSEWNEKSDPGLMLITDTETIFYDQKKNKFYFAAQASSGENVNLVDFVTNLLFEAVFKDKEIQTAAELINFIRASIHTSPRDIVLFLEMSKYGRTYTADWSKVKKAFETVVGHTDSLADIHKNKKLSKVNNSMDFSDFLSVDDLFSDAAHEQSPLSDKYTVYSRFEPEVQASESESIPVTVQQETVKQGNDFLYEQQNIPNEDDKEKLSAEEYWEEACENMPYVEDVPLYKGFVDEPLTEIISDDLLSGYEETTKNEEYIPYSEEKEEEYEEYYPVSNEEKDFDYCDDEDQTEILTKDDYEEKNVNAFLTDIDGTIFSVDKDYFVIGRNSKESDISVRDSSMSRRHAAIIKIGDDFYIEDLNSMNKTYLNGEQIMPNSRKLLVNGSVIFVSRNKFVFNVTY